MIVKLGFAFAALLFIGTTQRNFAQDSWQKVAPLGESFSVLMPNKPFEASRLIPLKDEASVPGRVYSTLSDGKRYIVASFVRPTQTSVTALATFDNFKLAMEHGFLPKEGEVRSLIFDQNLSDGPTTMAQYNLMLGKHSGVARFLGTERAFYALMVIGADKAQPEVQRFFSSFKVGEVNTNVEASGVTTGVVTAGSADPAVPQAGESLPPEPWPRPMAPISGGVLNGKAIELAQPQYPPEARANGDSGLVRVQIVIDELGNVISAKAVSGPVTLQDVSVAAALKSRFSPTRLMGQPVKVSGVILYNFVWQ